MNPTHIKKLLLNEIDNVCSNFKNFCFNPDKDFSRSRKLPLNSLIKSILAFGSKSIGNELIDLFDFSISPSAFVQQRNKLLPDAFELIFKNFSDSFDFNSFDGMKVFAVDGSDVQIPTNPNDPDSFILNGDSKSFNMLHINALYDLNDNIYRDVVIQKYKFFNEHKALCDMVDNSTFNNALIIADRGYESFNNMAHIQQKHWHFLFRVKDGKCGIKSGFVLPDNDEFDIDISLNLTRKQTNFTKSLFKDKNNFRFIPSSSTFDFLDVKNKKSDQTKFYTLNFRIVRFKLSDSSYETVVTNLDKNIYPPEKLKSLYSLRWGIETSFRDLKYSVGMLNFHSKKVTNIIQDIFASFIMYNFTKMITSCVVISKSDTKYTYKANFSISTHVCRLFYLGKISSPKLKVIISSNTIPIRYGRSFKRNKSNRTFHNFFYRVS